MADTAPEIDKPFWMLAKSVATNTVPAQVLSFLFLMLVLKIAARIVRRTVKLQWLIAVSMAGSFFLWPHVFSAYAYYTNQGVFTSAGILANFFNHPLGVLVTTLVLIPLLFNQASLFLVPGLIPFYLMSKSPRLEIRWLSYVGFAIILPVAWLLDCSFQ